MEEDGHIFRGNAPRCRNYIEKSGKALREKGVRRCFGGDRLQEVKEAPLAHVGNEMDFVTGQRIRLIGPLLVTTNFGLPILCHG
ncbi:MAG: hypothetical protein V2B19_15695 [Pseudomonadota bacterium]